MRTLTIALALGIAALCGGCRSKPKPPMPKLQSAEAKDLTTSEMVMEMEKQGYHLVFMTDAQIYGWEVWVSALMESNSACTNPASAKRLGRYDAFFAKYGKRLVIVGEDTRDYQFKKSFEPHLIVPLSGVRVWEKKP